MDSIEVCSLERAAKTISNLRESMSNGVILGGRRARIDLAVYYRRSNSPVDKD